MKEVLILGVSLIILIAWCIPTILIKINPKDRDWGFYYFLLFMFSVYWGEKEIQIIDKL